MEEEKIRKTSPRTELSDEAVFKATKEIVVKFIEVGRLTPASFEEHFERIYRAVERTVRHK